jgi:SulP family sulfate permease
MGFSLEERDAKALLLHSKMAEADFASPAALAAVLAIVSWNMAEKAEFAAILRRSRGDGLVLLATFLLTVFRDLTEGIAGGVVLGSVIFMHRMAELVQVQTQTQLIDEDRADSDGGSDRGPYAGPSVPADTLVYRISGPFFFGAASEVTAVLDRMGQTPRVVILDLSAVPFVDGTAALALEGFIAKAHRSGTRVWLAGASAPVRRVLVDHDVGDEQVGWAVDVAEALAADQAAGR